VFDGAIVTKRGGKIHLGLYSKTGKMHEARQNERDFERFQDELVLYIKMGNCGDAL
jgi:hypothetical protein